MFGGESDRALLRAARLGDGWLSGGVATDIGAIEERVARLRSFREAEGATRPFNVTVLHPKPSPEEMGQLEAIGVDRVVVMPWNRGRDAMDGLEAFAEGLSPRWLRRGTA